MSKRAGKLVALATKLKLQEKRQSNPKTCSNDNGVEAGCAGEEGGADGVKNITGPVTNAKPPDPDTRVNSMKLQEKRQSIAITCSNGNSGCAVEEGSGGGVKNTTCAVTNMKPPDRVNSVKLQEKRQSITTTCSNGNGDKDGCAVEEGGGVGVEKTSPMPSLRPPDIRVTSGEKVQQWLVTNIQGPLAQAKRPAVKRKLQFSGEKNTGDSILESGGPIKDANINPNPKTIRVAKRIISPVKHCGGKSKSKKQGAALSGGLGASWADLVEDSGPQPENCNIVMEYQKDDLRAPTFFIEENEDEILDLSPPKRPRLEHNISPLKVKGPMRRKSVPVAKQTGPVVTPHKSPNRSAVPRVSRKQILSTDNSGVSNTGRKEGQTVNDSPGTNWRKLTPPSSSHQPDKVSAVLDCDEENSRQSSFAFERDDVRPLDLSPSKSLESKSNASSPDRGNESMGENNADHNSDQESINNEMPPAASLHKRKMLPKESKRKRSQNPNKWQRKVAMKAFNDGTEHITSKGKVKEAREMGDPCRDGCTKCKADLTHQQREAIFHKFWNLPNINRKRDFISRHIKTRTPDTCSTSPECAKKTSRHYFFSVSGEEIFVCKTMFLSTLGVPDCWIETSLRKCKNGFGLSPDKRGKHLNRPNQASEDTIQSVKTHINLFPRVASHYTRERSQREYLETELKSVERMYRLYNIWAKETNVSKPASSSLYRKIFNTQFNLGFFLPKKDQCETCNKWKHAANQEERREIVQQYSTHLQNKKAVKEIKQKDVSSASETKCVACFDLQKVLICPRGETSIFFYKNKLSVFNFTIFDTRLSEGHCYVWTETDAHKGPNEIGTNLLRFIEKKASEGIVEFSFYSDGPTGQNRNRMIFSLYLSASAKFHVNITHRFLESGHSYSEADSMHARIEDEAKRVQEIFTPDEWINLIKNAKQSGKPYLVTTLKNEEVLDLHYLVDRQNWTGNSKAKIYWSQVREVSVHRDQPNILGYKYKFSDECSKLKVTMKNGNMPDMSTFTFPFAYAGRFPLNKNKANDLKELCRKKAIPSKYHETYETYLNIPEPNQDMEED